MITEGLILLFLSLANLVLGFLPDPASLPSGINSAFTLFAGFFQKANQIFPMDVVFTIIGLTLTIETGILAFQFGNWLYNKIRGAG